MRLTNVNRLTEPLFFIPALVGVLGGIGIIFFIRVLEYGTLFVISIIVLLISGFLMQYTVGVFNLRRITILGCWYLTYLAILFLPSFFVFFDVNGSSRNTFLFAVHSALLTVPAGAFFVNMMCRFRRAEIDQYFKLPVQDQGTDLHVMVACLVALAVASGLVLKYVSEVPTLALSYIIYNPGDPKNASLMRQASFEDVGPVLRYVYHWLVLLVFPLLAMVSFGFRMVTKKMGWLAVFLGSLGVGALFAALSTAKSLVASLVLVIFLFLYLYRGGRVSMAIVLSPVLVALYPLAVIMTIYWGEVDLGLALGTMGRRLFYLPAEVLYWYFELFQGNYLYGRSIHKLSWLMGWKFFDTANYVGLYGLHAKLQSINANGAFLGNLNADFGVPGVLAGGVIAGVVMQASQVYLIRRPKTIINLAVYAYLMLTFFMLHWTALPIVLFSNGALVALIVPWVFGISVRLLREATS